MKYERPRIRLIATRAENATADVCWAQALGKRGRPFYCDIPGVGYAELVVYETTGGCSGAIITIVGYHGGASISDEGYVRNAINAAANHPQNFKGSPFESKIDPSWS